MNKKYQVFISSTQKDLVDERISIMHALLESRCIPAGMELFPSANKKSWEFIKQDIDESDFYLLVIGGMYGSLTKDSQGKPISYTEKEYNYAINNNKPIMVFIYKDMNLLPAGKVERSQAGKKRLEKFINRILDSNVQVSFWLSAGDLISKIKSSIQELIRTVPYAGWVKGTEINHQGITDDYVNKLRNINEWGLDRIFKTRAEKNSESDPILESHNVKCLDGIAFGLSSFRSNREDDVLKCLQNGMNMRLLVMEPNSIFVHQREIEEDVHKDNISDSIKKLVEWANKLNRQSSKGKIIIKYYRAMTLDFYWRIDDRVYVGPYMYNIVSQQTVTLKYLKGGRGYKLYTQYFEKLWGNKNLCYSPEEYIVI